VLNQRAEVIKEKDSPDNPGNEADIGLVIGAEGFCCSLRELTQGSEAETSMLRLVTRDDHFL
jgi:hypothetical protein